jgi:hypothetical protein
LGIVLAAFLFGKCQKAFIRVALLNRQVLTWMRLSLAHFTFSPPQAPNLSLIFGLMRHLHWMKGLPSCLALTGCSSCSLMNLLFQRSSSALISLEVTNVD